MTEQSNELTFEQKLLAALAHGSIVAQGLGVVAGIVIYVNQREKSRWTAFQALQAAVYQVVALVIVIASWFVWGIFYGLSFIPLIGLPEGAAPPLIFWLGMASMAIPFVVMMIIGLYGVWGGIRTLQGKDFRYALIGKWLERSGFWQQA